MHCPALPCACLRLPLQSPSLAASLSCLFATSLDACSFVVGCCSTCPAGRRWSVRKAMGVALHEPLLDYLVRWITGPLVCCPSPKTLCLAVRSQSISSLVDCSIARSYGSSWMCRPRAPFSSNLSTCFAAILWALLFTCAALILLAINYALKLSSSWVNPCFLILTSSPSKGLHFKVQFSIDFPSCLGLGKPPSLAVRHE